MEIEFAFGILNVFLIHFKYQMTIMAAMDGFVYV